MKCALELLEIKTVAIKTWEEEERLKDMEAKLKHQERITKTIEYCDTELNDYFVNLAENRKPLSWSRKIHISEDRLGNVRFCFLYQDTVYANGTPSFTPTENYFDLQSFIEYLTAHCFKIEEKESCYRSYGCGSRECKEITVYVPKVGE